MAGIRPIAPISYTEGGRQFLIPSSAIEINESTNKIDVGKWKTAAGVTGKVEDWLTYLADNGTIARETSSQPPPAMVITAKDRGANGKTITVEVSNVDIAASKFDAKVTEIDHYAGLTPDTIETILGTSPHFGLQPGLVFVARTSTGPKMPDKTTTPLSPDSNGVITVM